MKLKTQYLIILGLVAVAVAVIGIAYIGTITPIMANDTNLGIKSLKSQNLVSEELSIAEHLWKILTEEYNLSLQEKITAMRIIDCESKFDPWAINKNSEGATAVGENSPTKSCLICLNHQKKH